MKTKKKNPKLSLWIIPAGLLIGLMLFGGLFAAVRVLRPEKGYAQAKTPVMTVIYAPTSTPVIPTVAATPMATSGSNGPTVGGIGVGMFVQISGTGGNGLRLRKDPGTKADILFLGYESEVFKVTDGPVDLDGYTWWHLTAPYDENRNGWAASNYLTVIEVNP